MKYTIQIILLLLSTFVFAQDKEVIQLIKGIIKSENTSKTVSNANIININMMKGSVSDQKGEFEIAARVNDTLHISFLGYKSINVRVTNDWIKNKTQEVSLTEKAYALEEIVIRPYRLTGFLDIDIKLVPYKENYRFGIAGSELGYEAGQYSPNAFGKVLGSLMNPADALYKFFGKKPRELKRLKEMKKDDILRNLLETKYDREMITTLLGIDKKEINEILQRCNFSESFGQTANDLQILDAISGCYEEYKILKKK
ncbi:MAG: hypothetical protein RLZZ312_1518 [Bacteroidota bacterium]|jgi:hypothetical protein